MYKNNPRHIDPFTGFQQLIIEYYKMSIETHVSILNPACWGSVWLETPGFQTLIYFPRWPCWEPSCRWQCGAPLRMHHQETGGCPNIQCPSFIFRQFLYLHKLWNLISSSLSDLGMVTGSFSHIVPMKRTQSGEKLSFCNDTMMGMWRIKYIVYALSWIDGISST